MGMSDRFDYLNRRLDDLRKDASQLEISFDRDSCEYTLRIKASWTLGGEYESSSDCLIDLVDSAYTRKAELTGKLPCS